MEYTEINVFLNPISKVKYATFVLSGANYFISWLTESGLEDDLWSCHRIELLQMLVQMVTEVDKVIVSINDLGESSYLPKVPSVAFHIWKNYTARSVLFDFGFAANEKMIWTKSLPPQDLTTHMKRANIE